MPVVHHELCFGCGRTNLFGLHLELEPADDGSLAGRFFVKQDHMGPPGHLHGGLLGTALDEAMALVLFRQGLYALTRRFELDLLAPVPVGTFVRLEARVERREGHKLWLTATASGEHGPVAQASALFIVPDHARDAG